MYTVDQNLVFRYYDLVEKYTLQPNDNLLKEAGEIGRTLVSSNYPLKNLADLQLEAMELVHVKHPTLNMMESTAYAYMPFKELMLAYDITYKRTIESNYKINTLAKINLEPKKAEEHQHSIDIYLKLKNFSKNFEKSIDDIIQIYNEYNQISNNINRIAPKLKNLIALKKELFEMLNNKS